MSAITLDAATRASLLSLQNTSANQVTTNAHLSTGKKVSSALDNPVSFFTAAGLDSRSSALNSLLDGISNGIQTIQAANQGLTSITSIVQQLQSTVKQARQDTSQNVTAFNSTIAATSGNASTSTNNSMSFKDAAGNTIASVSTFNSNWQGLKGASAPATIDGTNSGSIDISSASLSGGKVAVNVTAGQTAQQIADQINTQLAANSGGSSMKASVIGGKIQVSDSNNNVVSVGNTSGNANATAAAVFGATTTSTAGAALSVDQISNAINSNASLAGVVSASVVGGNLTLANKSTNALGVFGATASTLTGASTDTYTLNAGTAQPSSVRQSLANQFNSLITQLNSVAKDSGYNGTNLLQGDQMKVVFNELTGASQNNINVQNQKSDGTSFGVVNAANLGIQSAISSSSSVGVDFSSNTALDTLSDALTSALSTVQNQSSALGANLAVVQTRQDFTKNVVNILQTGSGNLTNADMNQEAANSQALSTRQSLGISALSLTNTANQGILQLLR
jgi:flagellin-like hook-associated protein FlgL